jgi:hypothetical protein
LIIQVIILLWCLAGWVFVAVWQARHLLGVRRAGALDKRYLWYGLAALPIWLLGTAFLIRAIYERVSA